jgi:transposase
MTQDGEVFLYCKSELKAKKEGAIQSRLEQFFEEGLEQIKSSLNKKGGTKKYDKVLERIGRLREKYKKINRFYEITVSEKNGRATDITWNYVKEQSNENFSGTYYLRTNRTDLSEKQIWQLYTMLTELEDGFRTLKSELNLCPIYHKKENRGDAHIFIDVLAYHIL